MVCLTLVGHTFAQEGETTPEPQQTDFITFYEAAMTEYRAQFKDRTLSDYRIGYLGSLTPSYEGELLSGDNIRANFPDVMIITSEEDRAIWVSEGEANAIVIHPSALSWIDTKWVQDAYLHGMAVGTIGMTYEQHAELTGDNCTLPAKAGNPAANNPKAVRPFNSTTILFSVWVLDDHLLTPEERELSYATGLSECDLPELDREVGRGTHSGYNILDFDQEDGLEQLERGLIFYAGTRERFIGEMMFQDELINVWHSQESGE
jgi:hypothetical protein